MGGGRWWRHSRYEIRDGYIVPAKGAKLVEYDPWKFHRKRGELLAITEPPYLSLFKAVEPWEHGIKAEDEPGTEQAILGWCNRFGLLGLLHQEAVRIIFRPRREPDRQTDDFLQIQYVKGPYCWDYPARVVDPMGNWRQVKDKNPDELVFPSAEPPSVLMRSVSDGAIHSETIRKGWGRYFPAIPERERESYRYPLPDTKAFFEIYAEPVSQFIDSALWFMLAVKGIAGCTEESLSEFQKVDRRDRLARLSSSGGPMTDPKTGDRSITWNAPSLLAHMALMATVDMSENRILQPCENCKTLIVTGHARARYCSYTCRRAAQARVYRANLKKKSP